MQCDYFDAGSCRSCALMGVPYADQLAAKQERCEAALADVAPGLVWSHPQRSAESGFRNKAKLVVGGRAGRVSLGILVDGRGVDLRHCGLYEPALAEAIPRLARVVDDLGLAPYDVPKRRGELKYLLATVTPAGQAMLRVVLRSERDLPAVRGALASWRGALPGLTVASVNLHPEHKATLEGDTEILLTEQDTLEMPLSLPGRELRLRLRPGSFFQTNTAVATALYAQARAWAEAPRQILDLYCGVGGFALALAAPGREVTGVEVSAAAVTAAREAAMTAPGRVRFRVGDATAYVDEISPDLVVVNPPRRGLGPELAARLNAASVPRVLYSSCDVTSLARDLAAMPALRPARARLFDMFPQTAHHEVLVELRRN
jgi:23S rRNA (uracil747-C5)-methyltransferase